MSRGNTQIFSRIDQCDDEIIKIVKSYSEYGKVIVVSNDNYVRNGCRPYASLMHAEDLFRTKNKKNDKKEKDQTKKIQKSLSDKITEEYRHDLGL